MKKLIAILLAVWPIATYGANPSFTSFPTSNFNSSVTLNVISITNVSGSTGTNMNLFTSTNWGDFHLKQTVGAVGNLWLDDGESVVFNSVGDAGIRHNASHPGSGALEFSNQGSVAIAMGQNFQANASFQIGAFGPMHDNIFLQQDIDPGTVDLTARGFQQLFGPSKTLMFVSGYTNAGSRFSPVTGIRGETTDQTGRTVLRFYNPVTWTPFNANTTYSPGALQMEVLTNGISVLTNIFAGSITVTNSETNLSLTATSILGTDGNKAIKSVALSGLTYDGTTLTATGGGGGAGNYVTNAPTAGTSIGTNAFIAALSGLGTNITIRDTASLNRIAVTDLKTSFGGPESSDHIIVTNFGLTYMNGVFLFMDNQISGALATLPTAHWITTNRVLGTGWTMDTNEVMTYKSNGVATFSLSTNGTMQWFAGNGTLQAQNYYSNGVLYVISSNNANSYIVSPSGDVTFANRNITNTTGTYYGRNILGNGGQINIGGTAAEWSINGTLFPSTDDASDFGLGNKRPRFVVISRSITVGNAAALAELGSIEATNNIRANRGIFTNGVSSLANHTPGSVTVGASPFTFVNTTPVAMNCFITGSVAYSVALNGVSVYGSLVGNDYVPLQTNSSLTITYTVAPTMTTNSW